MRTGINECKHCLDEYDVQFSGENVLDIPREYQDHEYCPECKKAIVDALAKIPKKYAYKYVKTTEVDLDTLERWEQEKIDEINKKGGIHSIRVIATLMNGKTGEHQKAREVIGREDKLGRVYVYCYWPSKREECSITVQKRIKLDTGEEIRYKIKR